MDAVMQSDFIFDRNVSNAPFIPLAYLQYSYYDNTEFSGSCPSTWECSLDMQNFSQGLAVPVWTQGKNMLMLGGAIGVDRLKTTQYNQDIYSVGFLAAWVQQYNDEWQLAAYLFPQVYSNIENYSSYTAAAYTGFIGRYRHDARFHSYWGVAADIEEHESWYLPYIGFDWYIDRRWTIAMVMPWPTVSYAPTQDFFISFGALYGGSEWRAHEDQNTIHADISYWDFGFSLQQRLKGQFWGSASIGVSGLGKFTLDNNGRSSLDVDLDRAPFLRVGIEFRPDNN